VTDEQDEEIAGEAHFQNEQEEELWWASSEGRPFLKQQPTAPPDAKRRGPPLVSRLKVTSSLRIALRLPAPDIAKAREIAERKGIG
jgi:hypothetical protein